MTYYPSPKLFALLIGINKYKDPNIQNLAGAVADVYAMRNFLLSTFSRNKITILRDEKATRILQELL